MAVAGLTAAVFSAIFVVQLERIEETRVVELEPILFFDPVDLPTLEAAMFVTVELVRQAAGINIEVKTMDWSAPTSRRAEKKKPAEGGWHTFDTLWTAPDLNSTGT